MSSRGERIGIGVRTTLKVHQRNLAVAKLVFAIKTSIKFFMLAY